MIPSVKQTGVPVGGALAWLCVLGALLAVVLRGELDAAVGLVMIALLALLALMTPRPVDPAVGAGMPCPLLEKEVRQKQR